MSEFVTIYWIIRERLTGRPPASTREGVIGAIVVMAVPVILLVLILEAIF